MCTFNTHMCDTSIMIVLLSLYSITVFYHCILSLYSVVVILSPSPKFHVLVDCLLSGLICQSISVLYSGTSLNGHLSWAVTST